MSACYFFLPSLQVPQDMVLIIYYEPDHIELYGPGEKEPTLINLPEFNRYLAAFAKASNGDA